jgi:hypothetical protein
MPVLFFNSGAVLWGSRPGDTVPLFFFFFFFERPCLLSEIQARTFLFRFDLRPARFARKEKCGVRI